MFKIYLKKLLKIISFLNNIRPFKDRRRRSKIPAVFRISSHAAIIRFFSSITLQIVFRDVCISKAPKN